jgi:hypothetical protein
LGRRLYGPEWIGGEYRATPLLTPEKVLYGALAEERVRAQLTTGILIDRAGWSRADRLSWEKLRDRRAEH